MALAPGTCLGVYEITAQIGEGGMGAVYRATDTSLSRQVAIKVLPDAFASEPGRLARFEREAKTLASLNHPHIAAIYGFETSAGLHALVMELVEGEDLSQRIARGALPLDEVLPIAKQIAEALEAAHEQGIIHRDLKPANIKVRADGVVKVLDFGLAKALDTGAGGAGSAGRAGGENFTQSPTITTPAMTQAGMILGTAAYMSPEQARGMAVDKRADLWTFGVVLWEMLTRKRLFESATVSDTLAAVLKMEPEWSAISPTTPSAIRRLLRRCLEKDRRQRLADAADARLEIEEALIAPSEEGVEATHRPGRAITVVVLAAVAALALTAIAARIYVIRSAMPTAARFFVLPPDDAIFQSGQIVPFARAAISPDGRTLAFTAKDMSGKILLWLRPIDGLTAQPLLGSDGATFPFWSPDSRSIAYFAQGKLFTIDAAGGPPHTLCDAQQPRGGTWNRDGLIVFADQLGALLRVSSSGGQPVSVMPAAAGQQDQRFPSFLPDQHHVLFYDNASDPERAGVHVLSLDSGESKRLVGADTGGVYASPGHLLFVRRGTLLAQSFDPERLQLSGDPVAVAERVEASTFSGVVTFSVSDTGTLAYGVGSPANPTTSLQLTWLDRQGKTIASLGAPGNYRGLDLSPDGARIVAHRHDGRGGDLWLFDASRNTPLRATFDDAWDNSSPTWSPDGKRIAFASFRARKWALYEKLLGAANDELLMESDVPVSPMGWSPDGHSLVYRMNTSKTAVDLWMLPLSSSPPGRKPVPLLDTAFNETHGQVSSDGKWLAYSSDESSGGMNIYVRPFPTGEGKRQVSTNGGQWPRWRRDARELFYVDRANNGTLMSVDVNVTGSALEVTTPRALFEPGIVVGGGHVSNEYFGYVVSANGQRFLVPRSVSPISQSPGSSRIAVVLNWMASLKK